MKENGLANRLPPLPLPPPLLLSFLTTLLFFFFSFCCRCCYFVCLFMILSQNLTMRPWLTSNLLHKPDWAQIP